MKWVWGEIYLFYALQSLDNITNEKQQKNPIKNDVQNFDILKFSINFLCELHHKSNLTYRLT